MVRYIASRVVLDGTNDQDVDLTAGGEMVSLTIYGDTTTLTLQVRPGTSGDFLPLNSGDTLSLSEPGRTITPTKVRLRSTAALTAYVIVGYP